MAPEKGFLPWSFSIDGRTLAMEEVGAGALMHIWALSMEGDRARKPLLYQEKHSEAEPEISSDGRWIAYTSDESGRNEVYVRPFPEVDKGKWQVSMSGGAHPLWSPDGQELFFLSEENAVMAVPVETDPQFKINGTPTVLFQAESLYPGSSTGIWHISPKDGRFLMLKDSGTGAPRKINIVVNWLEELKQKVSVQ
jgi:eukaryotic-like serine/threonine-protein kinase